MYGTKATSAKEGIPFQNKIDLAYAEIQEFVPVTANPSSALASSFC